MNCNVNTISFCTTESRNPEVDRIGLRQVGLFPLPAAALSPPVTRLANLLKIRQRVIFRTVYKILRCLVHNNRENNSSFLTFIITVILLLSRCVRVLLYCVLVQHKFHSTFEPIKNCLTIHQSTKKEILFYV